MSRHPERARDYLEHILEAIERVRRYTDGRSQAEFLADTLMQDGVLRNLGVVGEAARRLLADAPEYAAAHPEIPLAKINATRNRVIHAYEEVDLDLIWNLVQFDVSELRLRIVTAIDEFPLGNAST